MTNSMKEIVENIKDIISTETQGRVNDGSVAESLGCSRGALATAKSRNVIMYQQISEFCAKRRIAINAILFSQLVDSLVEPTSAYEIGHFGLAS